MSMRPIPSQRNQPPAQEQIEPPIDKEAIMGRQTRLLFGISVFWLALSVLFDGINTLVLPLQLGTFASPNNQATFLGLLTFIGLLTGALVQPIAGAFSDQLQPIFGRKGFIGLGLLLSLVSLFLFAALQSLAGIILGYLMIQVF